jgi:hypothetical protein
MLLLTSLPVILDRIRYILFSQIKDLKFDAIINVNILDVQNQQGLLHSG